MEPEKTTEEKAHEEIHQEVKEIDAQINALSMQAETKEGEEKSTLMEKIQYLTSKKDEIMKSVESVKEIGAKLGDLKDKAKDILGGLHF